MVGSSHAYNKVLAWAQTAPGKRTVVRISRFNRSPSLQLCSFYKWPSTGLWGPTKKIVAFAPHLAPVIIEAIQYGYERSVASGAIIKSHNSSSKTALRPKIHKVISEGIGAEWDCDLVGHPDHSGWLYSDPHWAPPLDHEYQGEEHDPAQAD